MVKGNPAQIKGLSCTQPTGTSVDEKNEVSVSDGTFDTGGSNENVG